ncbi:glycosyltransferase family 2 protein [Helicobacter sp. T3_23-1056]
MQDIPNTQATQSNTTQTTITTRAQATPQTLTTPQTPLVSIIIPIYNVAPYLKECLDSIISQSYENLDIILVDDGSSDESLDIALDFARQDKRIFVISKPNGGLSSARNFGLECIKGSALRGFFESSNKSSLRANEMSVAIQDLQTLNVDCHDSSLFNKSLESRNDIKIQSLAQTHTFTKTYKTITKQEIDAHFTQIAPNFIKSDLERINDFITQELPKDALIHFVDSDDTITNDCIQKCVARLLKWDLDIAVHNWLEYDDTTKQSTKGAYLSNLKQNEYNTGLELLTQNKIYDFYFSPQGLFRAEILNRYALRYTEGIYHEDHDFGTLLFCLACKVAYANEGLYIYRKRATSIINVQKQAAFPAQIPSFLEPLRGDFSDYKSLREYFRAYCFVRLGFIIWEFYEAQLSQNGGQKLDFSAKYERFFSSVILGYAMKVFKTPLSKDTLGIQSMLATLKFPKISVWWHFVKDLHRQPKKLRYIRNMRYFR